MILLISGEKDKLRKVLPHALKVQKCMVTEFFVWLREADEELPPEERPVRDKECTLKYAFEK